MTGDAYGTHGDAPASGPASIPAQRSGADLVAPVTLGRPRWMRRHAHWSSAVDAVAVASSPALYLLWRDTVALPAVAVALSVVALVVAGRTALRGWLHHLRRQGRAMSTMLAVGAAEDVAALVDRTRRSPRLGWRVGGACTPTGAGPGGVATVVGVPVLGDLDAVATVALNGRFDAVSVAPAPGWTSVRLHQLATDLDCSRTALLADPRLVRSAGPHLRVTGVDGLPLLRLAHPSLCGLRRLAKGATDRAGALVLIALVAPILVSCALAVRRDGGPALQRQDRLGRGGRSFSLLTFRTCDIRTGALTPVGRVLHRHCLDELPQLLNVLGGSMALVGPRPLRPAELAGLDRLCRRRLLVKPGITGLWQVRGTCPDLSWEEAEGLDLRYVEDWSPVLDARILARTVRTALSSRAPSR